MAVILFTGHRLDEQGRATPRFPPERVSLVRRRLGEALTTLSTTSPIQAAVCSLAAGGDLLFAQHCIRLNIKLYAVLPFQEADFIAQSVVYEKVAGPAPDWLALFNRARQAATSVEFSSTAPFRPDEQQFQQCNALLLRRAQQLAAAAHVSVQALLLLQDAQPTVSGGSQQFSTLLRQQHISLMQVLP